MLHRGTFYSVGGGFVVTEAEAQSPTTLAAGPAIPHPFENAAELLEIAEREKVSIAEIMMRNECASRSEQEVRSGIDRICAAMNSCIDRGMREDGILPGGLNVKRRAKKLREMLEERERNKIDEGLIAMDWINVWALAVNEENAAGGKVVTAPTNGAAGLVPAVLRYYDRFCKGTVEGRHTFLLTAAAIGSLYKRNASISAAEVGCQGEIGVACSIAAAGLAAAQGGTNEQIENAAEIGMEHNLGTHLRSDSRPGADPVHRAQCYRRGEGDRRSAPRADGRRDASRHARPRHRDDAPDRRRHARLLQRDLARRTRGQRSGMLSLEIGLQPDS